MLRYFCFHRSILNVLADIFVYKQNAKHNCYPKKCNLHVFDEVLSVFPLKHGITTVGSRNVTSNANLFTSSTSGLPFSHAEDSSTYMRSVSSNPTEYQPNAEEMQRMQQSYQVRLTKIHLYLFTANKSYVSYSKEDWYGRKVNRKDIENNKESQD